MKKNIKKITILIFLFLISFTSVHAWIPDLDIPGAGYRDPSIREKWAMVKNGQIYGELTSTKVLWKGGEKTSPSNPNLTQYFPRITKMFINGNPALCIDPNTPAIKGHAYIRSEKASSVKDSLAYGIIESSISDTSYYIAQIFAHGEYSASNEGIRGAARDYLIYFLGYSPKTAEESAKTLAPVARSTNAVIWDSICGGGQRFVSTYVGKKCTQDFCKTDCSGIIEDETCLPDDPDCMEEDKCPDPSAKLAKACEVNNNFDDPGTTLEFGGAEDWTCIAGKSDYEEENWSLGNNNPYCSMFCQEHAYSDFPDGSQTFQAGKYFVIGNSRTGTVSADKQWAPISFYGIRTCKVYKDKAGKIEGINTQQFVSDYNAVINQMPDAYTTWKNSEREVAAYAAATRIQVTQSNYGSYPEGSCWNKTYHTVSETVKEDDWVQCAQDAPCFDRWGYKLADGWGRYIAGTKDVVIDRQEVNSADKWDYRQYIGPYSYTKYDTSGRSWTVNVPGGCGGTVPTINNAYSNLERRKTGIETNISVCAAASSQYEFNPAVNVEYNPGSSYPSSYGYSGTLDPQIINDNRMVFSGQAQSVSSNGITKCVGAGCEIKYYSCNNGLYCKKGPDNILEKELVADVNGITYNGEENKSNMNMTGIKSLNSAERHYVMPEDAGYQYIWKATAYMDNTQSKGQQIDLGYKVIPLHFMMRPGTYRISLDYSNIGHNGHFDEYIETAKTADTFPYVCKFNLINDLVCNPDIPSDDPDCPGNNLRDCTGGDCPRVKGGIDVIYRTIELEDRSRAFPSVNGDGRTPGSNWSSTITDIHHDCNWDREKKYTDVYQYITCNRGVQGDRIYNNADGTKGLEPIYRIVLTPTNIKQIREHNKKKLTDGIDTKDKAGYGDFALNCNDNGRNCVSRFIHEGLAQGISLDIDGTCMDVNVASEEAFNACRYTKEKYQKR